MSEPFKKLFDSFVPGFLKIYIHSVAALCLGFTAYSQTPIDRKEVVDRHRVLITSWDSLSSLSVGNGNFAFTVDPTGLQSFPEQYVHGVPLGTQSSWGWHSFPNNQKFTLEETFKEYVLNGKKINYSVQDHISERNTNAVNYFRSNPHRVHLANVGLEFGESNLDPKSDIVDIKQQLDLWSGTILSQYKVDQIPVEVITAGHPVQDLVAFRIKTKLLSDKKIKIRIRIPAPTGDWKDAGNHWIPTSFNSTSLSKVSQGVNIHHRMDTNSYFIQIRWEGNASLITRKEDYFILQPEHTDRFEFSVRFVPVIDTMALPTFKQTLLASKQYWKSFWMSGGAIDLSACQDPRAMELERRIVLSQYLTRIQCASDQPPQETGLTFNSWFGRPHLEMYWWHALHFVLWGRPELMEKSLDWYFKALSNAQKLALRQGYSGARWQKMTDRQAFETPSSVGAFLIWQQPHVIYLCELLNQLYPKRNLVTKYQNLVFETAEFMADYLAWDSVNQQYRLGPGLIPAQESHDPMTTINPTFELAYWHWGLTTAQAWRTRLGLPENKEWAIKLRHLAPLPVKDGTYLAALSAPDSYTREKFLSDHPSVLGAFAGLPASNGLDEKIMNQTLDTILKKWNWSSTWGWDYPLIAMAATRLYRPEVAINALLMNTQKNTYLVNGHNYQDPRLTIYLPGNGGLLAAIAMMCAGSRQQRKNQPGFPATWKIKWEKLNVIF